MDDRIVLPRAGRLTMWQATPYAVLVLLGVSSLTAQDGPYPAAVMAWDAATKQAQLDAGRQVVADLEAAIQAGAKRFDIPQGIYRLDEFTGEGRGKGWYLRLLDVHDFVLDGHGSTFYFSKPGHALSLYKCSGVTVRNLTFDWDPLPFAQGRITALADNRVTIQLDAGYAMPDNIGKGKGPRGMVFDDDGMLKANQGGFALSDREDLGDGQVRLRVWGFYNAPLDKLGLAVGDPIAVWSRVGRAVIVEVTEDILLEDITLYAAGFVGFVGNVGAGPITYRRCKILRRPGTNRLIGGNADGFNVSNMRRGPILEDCEIQNIGDDFVNIHGSYYRVFDVESPTQLVVQASPGAGDEPVTLRFISPAADHTFLGEAKVVTRERITYVVPADFAGEAWHANLNFKPGDKVQAERLVLDQPITVGEVGAIFDSSAAVCANAVVRNCRFTGSLARGIRLQSIGALIEGNTLTRTMGAGMTFNGQPGFWGESTNSRHVVVRHNTIAEAGWSDSRWGRSAICVATSGDPETGDLVSDILFQGNTILRPAGSAFYLKGCQDVVLRDNTIQGWGALASTAPEPLAGYGKAILDLASSGLKLDGNTQVDPGPYAN